jgi:hypothetical protein
MSRRFIIGFLLMALTLSACAPGGLPTSSTLTVSMDRATATRQPGCTVTSRKAGLDPTAESPIPPVNQNDWVIGPEDAYVTIIEYGDFQ